MQIKIRLICFLAALCFAYICLLYFRMDISNLIYTTDNLHFTPISSLLANQFFNGTYNEGQTFSFLADTFRHIVINDTAIMITNETIERGQNFLAETFTHIVIKDTAKTIMNGTFDRGQNYSFITDTFLHFINYTILNKTANDAKICLCELILQKTSSTTRMALT